MYPFQINLPLGHAWVERIRTCHLRGATALRVRRLESQQVGQCYENVSAVVSRRGGEMVFGWLITAWPGRYVEALHHAVWRKAAGDLHDVTAPAYPSARGTGTFVPDERQDYDLALGPSVPSRFLALGTSQETQAFITATVQVTEAMQDYISFATANGRVSGEGSDAGVSFDDPTHRALFKDKEKRIRNLHDLKLLAVAALFRTEPRLRAREASLCPCGSRLPYRACHDLLASCVRANSRL